MYRLALLAEIVFIVGIISYVPSVEINWQTDMAEVSGFLGGQLNYTKLDGSTGPFEYPAGFLWLYSALYYATHGGTSIITAQWIFAGVYWLTIALFFGLYKRLRMPGMAVIPFFLSRCIRSIYVLRLFNDCWVMLVLYAAVTVLAGRRHWILGCLLYSVALSIKMSCFLFAPGLFYVLLRSLPLWRVVLCVLVCAGWQLLVAYPFLLYDGPSYRSRVFDLGQIFTVRGSVNFQFVPEEIYVRPEFGHTLLALTVLTWVVQWRTRWRHRPYIVPVVVHTVQRNGDPVKRSDKKGQPAIVDPDVAEENASIAVILTLLESNIIGVAFARSLHYQFLTWFFHAVPAVLYYTSYPKLLAVIVFALIRYGFDAYPRTPTTSALLMGGMSLLVLGSAFFGKPIEACASALQTSAAPKTTWETAVASPRKMGKFPTDAVPSPVGGVATITAFTSSPPTDSSRTLTKRKVKRKAASPVDASGCEKQLSTA